MKLQAAPGIYLIKLLKEESAVNVGSPKDRKILKGKIVSVGADREHDNGGMMKAVYKKGDIVFFFSYVDGADVFRYEKEDYYCVVINDMKAKIDEN